MTKINDVALETAATGCTEQLTNDDLVSICIELQLAREYIRQVSTLLTGCTQPSFVGWENGDGINVGDGIDAARLAYQNH
ncbi:MAG: hypothetical protein Q7K26_01760 [bacterium]|nr:hypothetical protein [bacterium]